MELDSTWWNECAAAGNTLVNAEARKIAVFPNSDGCITIVVSDDECALTSIDVEEAHRMVAMLRDAIDVAVPIANRIDADYRAYLAAEKASAGDDSGN